MLKSCLDGAAEDFSMTLCFSFVYASGEKSLSGESSLTWMPWGMGRRSTNCLRWPANSASTDSLFLLGFSFLTRRACLIYASFRCWCLISLTILRSSFSDGWASVKKLHCVVRASLLILRFFSHFLRSFSSALCLNPIILSSGFACDCLRSRSFRDSFSDGCIVFFCQLKSYSLFFRSYDSKSRFLSSLPNLFFCVRSRFSFNCLSLLLF